MLFVSVAGVICLIMGIMYTRLAIHKQITESTLLLGIAFLLLAIIYFGVDIKMILTKGN